MLIGSLMETLAPSAPTKWIQLCRKMVLTSDRSKSTTVAGSSRQETTEETEDDEGMLSNQSKQSPLEEKEVFVPRWRTKFFSIECIRRLIGAVKEQFHFDLALAREKKIQGFSLPFWRLCYVDHLLIFFFFLIFFSQIASLCHSLI